MTGIMDMELLAPAGSQESLTAAVRLGADAVYLGLPMFNARQNAKNFDGQSLDYAIEYAHRRGAKVYLTLNTLVFDDELPLLYKMLRLAALAGVDAILVQDLAVAALVRACAPSIPLHASTQMSVHNLDGAKKLKALGFSRVVLAREMTKDEIAAVSRERDIETECFVHGALCMCMSGQCYLSSVIGGRSGNRGLCAQPCRLPFKGKGDRGKKGGRYGEYYPLSLKDVSLVTRLNELRSAGVRSLKIEGRMKRPEYVAAAVTACRSALDGQEPDMRTLEAVFSRSGFTDGYFTGRRDGTMFGIRQKDDVTAAAPVLGGLAKLYKDENPLIDVDFHLILRGGEASELTATDCAGHTARAAGDVPQTAISSPTTKEKAEASLSRTGGTFFRVRNITAELEPNLMMPSSGLNELRRRALEKLTRLRGEVCPHEFIENRDLLSIARKPHPAAGSSRPLIRVRLHTAKQLTPYVIEVADEITLPLREFGTAAGSGVLHHDRDLQDKLMVEIPPVAFGNSVKEYSSLLQNAVNSGVRHAVAGSLGAIELASRHGLQIHGDFGLNITNSLALEEYRRIGLCDATLSFELDLHRIKNMGGKLRRGILAYGYLPLMRMRNCPVAAQGGCKNCRGSFPVLTDRKDNRLFVDCGDGISTLYNCVPLFLSDKLDDISGTDFLTLYFTKEEPWECDDVLSLYKAGKGVVCNITRGLYYRKVL